MDQQDIFRLTLIVLLIANRQLSSDSDEAKSDDFSYTFINDLLLLSLALNGFSNGNDNKNGTTF